MPDLAGCVCGLTDDQLNPNKHQPCPECGGTDRFRAFDDVAETGGLFCNQCHSQKNGDGFATIMWLRKCTFPEAVDLVADAIGQSLPDPLRNGSDTRKDLFSDIQQIDQSDDERHTTFTTWATGRPPITPEAVHAAGAFVCNSHGTKCVAFPAWRGDEVSGIDLYRIDGQPFNGGNKDQNVGGSKDGWIMPGGSERLRSAETVWKVEGIPDALALHAVLPDPSHAVVTNICGALSGQCPVDVLEGKNVHIIGDADKPGQDGAKKFADRVKGTAKSVRVVNLPFPIENDHGRDLRDFLNDGRTFTDLLTCTDGRWKLKSAWDAVKHPAEMREVIIEGLARRGEVVNIVASTKVGKSWLALLLLFAVVTGRKWLGRKTTPGRVLLIDNELHDETIQNRLETVARHLSVSCEEQPPFDYVDLRGEIVGIHDIERELSRFKAGELTLVVLDAKYRFFGAGRQENSNDDQTEFHNSIDRLARQLNCVIALVHHSTKGSQSSKSATDVGSGGGSQSRAVDCHLVIRSHEKADDLAVLDAAVRTFAPVESQTIRWEFPLWAVADDVQPVLKQESTRGDSRQEAKDEIGINELERILGEGPTDGMTRYELHQQFGGGKDRLNRLLRLGEWTSRFVQDGTRTTRNKRQSTVYKMASPSRQKPDLSGLFERTE